MAIYHLSVKTLSRSDGRSATAAAAYRSASRIIDERTGEIHDYTHKQGVVSRDLILPGTVPDWAQDRAQLWNVIEQTERRVNSTVAREFEIALPDELNAAQRQQLALSFARELVAQHGFIADVCIHEPSRDGDGRNHHAHILCSTRRLEGGTFTDKTRELDEVKHGVVQHWRARYAELQNQHLQAAGQAEQVDHRSLKAQGIARPPTAHLGPAATNYERRTGRPSKRRQELEQEISERLARARAQGELERQAARVQQGLIEASADLAQARQERDAIERQATTGRSAFRARFEADTRQPEVAPDIRPPDLQRGPSR